MSTVVLNLYTKAYSSISNRIRCAVIASDGVTVIASQIDTTSGHPQRTWTFPGLPRNNYGVSLDEIDGGGNPVNNLALFSVVPGQIDSGLIRPDEQLKVGAVSSGMVAGLQVATFDGSAGKPDFRDWNIVPSELTGRGILVRGVDYSWDSLVGTFTMLQSGDVFQPDQWWNFHFDSKSSTAGNSYSTVNDFTARIVTVSDTVLISDFGNAIIAEPAGELLTESLPSILNMPVGRALKYEVSPGVLSCVRIVPFGADVIKFGTGIIYILPGESIKIYVYSRNGNKEWRVLDYSGNFASVGKIVSFDQTGAGLKNLQAMDGSSVSVLKYARIYNELVLNIPLLQVVNYDDWATGNNKYFFSLANSANPLNAGKFLFPDRRSLYQKNNSTGKAGDLVNAQVGEFDLTIPFPTGDGFLNHPYLPTALGKGLNQNAPFDLVKIFPTNTGKENLVKSYIINQYIQL